MRSAQDGTLPVRDRDAWFAGMCSINFIVWQTAAILGCIGASFVPTEWGLEFTGTLALIALVGPSLNARPAVIGALVAALVALFTYALPYKLGLFCGAIAGIIAAALTDALRSNEPPAAPESA
jgi:predicted branched-subunit amino acid permease